MSSAEVIDLVIYVMKKFDIYVAFVTSFKAILVALLILFVVKRG